MGTSLPRGPPHCSRVLKTTSPPASQPLSLSSQGRAAAISYRQRRLAISAFLFNPSSSSSSASGSGGNRSRETIANRLSELRSRPEDEERALLDERPEHSSLDEASTSDSSSQSGGAVIERGLGLRAQRQMGPLPAEPVTSDDEGDQLRLEALSSGGHMTPRSLRHMVSDPKPEIKLLHRFKSGQASQANQEFWRSFVDKCRLAWGVFFPPAPHQLRRSGAATASGSGSAMAQWAGGLGRLFTTVPAGGGEGAVVNGLTAKHVVLSRLQMVLIADRCGVSPEHLLEMKAQTLTALAEYMGKDLQEDVAQLEVQVSALKPNGERITMTIGFAEMLADEELRDPMQYHYEYEDDDDYFLPDQDDGQVADIAEAPMAGLQAARVAAKPVAGGPAGQSESG